MGGAKLGVVQEKGSLGCSLLLEGDGCRFGVALGLDVDIVDLAADGKVEC